MSTSSSHLEPRVQAIMRAMGPPTWRFPLLMSIAALGFAWGAFAYFVQLRDGLAVTGLNRPVYWGFYMSNFVFFIAISFGGTLVSAVLRLAGADWRHPITRAAEGLTVAALLVGAPQVIIDMGRPEQLLQVFAHPNPMSPILWDIVAISLYFVASLVFLYIPLIPDLSYCRDHLPNASPLRRRIYGALALGWRGSPRQLERMHRWLGIMAVALIPIAVLVHSVLAWVFSTTVQPGWHSTILAPYFVLGALFSGTGAVIVLLGILRRTLKLELVLRPEHFKRLGRALICISLVWAYFTFTEFLTSYCGQEPVEMAVLQSKLSGPFSGPFWAMIVLCLPVPLLLLLTRRNAIGGAVLAGLSVNVGLWLERYLIVVPTLTTSRTLGTATLYSPTWVEWGILLGSFSGMFLFYGVFTRLVPVVSIWELSPSETVPSLDVVAERRAATRRRASARRRTRRTTEKREQEKVPAGLPVAPATSYARSARSSKPPVCTPV